VKLETAADDSIPYEAKIGTPIKDPLIPKKPEIDPLRNPIKIIYIIFTDISAIGKYIFIILMIIYLNDEFYNIHYRSMIVFLKNKKFLN
jgi:hypothetical protein